MVEVPGGPAGKLTVVGPMGEVPAGLLLSTMAAAPAGAAMAVCRGYCCWCRRLRCQRPGELGSAVTTVPGTVAADGMVHCSPAAACADTHTLLVGAGVLLLTMEVVVTGWRQPMLLSAAASLLSTHPAKLANTSSATVQVCRCMVSAQQLLAAARIDCFRARGGTLPRHGCISCK